VDSEGLGGGSARGGDGARVLFCCHVGLFMSDCGRLLVCGISKMSVSLLLVRGWKKYDLVSIVLLDDNERVASEDHWTGEKVTWRSVQSVFSSHCSIIDSTICSRSLEPWM
jgi:hypothetical protein